MKKHILIFVLLGPIGFSWGAWACPTVATYPVRGLYYGRFPVYVEAGSAWDVECALNTWEGYINTYAGYCYDLFATDDSSVPSIVRGGIADNMAPNAFAATFRQVDAISKQIKSFEIYYNNVTYGNWCFGEPESCANGLISFLAVITHEIGHGIGLGHADMVCSCAAFQALSLEEKKEAFPTMSPGGAEGACLSYGVYQPHMLLHTIAEQDEIALGSIYQGVVSVEEPFECAEIGNGELTIKLDCEEFEAKLASLYVSENQDGPIVALPGNPYDVIIEGTFCGLRVTLPSSSSPSWTWYRFEGESTTRGPFEVSIEDKPTDASSGALSASPNPFTSSTTITYTLSKPGKINLTVYNPKGQKVAEVESEPKAAGEYSVTWDAKGKDGKTLPSGVYFARLQGGSLYKTCKLILAK